MDSKGPFKDSVSPKSWFLRGAIPMMCGVKRTSPVLEIYTENVISCLMSKSESHAPETYTATAQTILS